MSAERWKLAVDRDKCIGSGLCAGMAPDHFELADGHSHPIADEVDPADEVRDAAESCPVEAIRVFAAGTGSVLYPED